MFLIVIVPLLICSVDFIKITRRYKNTFEIYSEANNLPVGVIYGDYWDVYSLSAATEGNVIGVSMNDWDFRNKRQINSIMERNVWFLYPKNLSDEEARKGNKYTALNSVTLENTGRIYPIYKDTLIEFRMLTNN
jgi:hypothetical protein